MGDTIQVGNEIITRNILLRICTPPLHVPARNLADHRAEQILLQRYIISTNEISHRCTVSLELG
jgi:hypothetical protein